MAENHVNDHKMPNTGDWIELGINPPLDLQFLGQDYTDRKMNFQAYWTNRFKKQLKGYKDYTANLEISRGGLLHYHVLIRVGDPEELLSSILNIRTGSVKRGRYPQEVRMVIYDVKNLSERIDYVFKDHDRMKYQLCPKNGEIKRGQKSKFYKPKGEEEG